VPRLRPPGPIGLLLILASPSVAQEVLWEQLPIEPDRYGWAMSSQEDVCYPFVSWIADDFVGGDEEVASVRWWGAFWNGAADLASEAIVEVWTPRDDGRCPEFGARIFTARTSSFSQSATVLPGGQRGFEYHAVLPDPFRPVDGERYFVSIQLAICYPPQWGITMGAGNGRECCYDGDWPPDWTWLPASQIFGEPHESAFVLYGPEPTPAAPTSWSRLKGLYGPTSRVTPPSPGRSRGAGDRGDATASRATPPPESR